jgi:hypothetical protein
MLFDCTHPRGVLRRREAEAAVGEPKTKADEMIDESDTQHRGLFDFARKVAEETKAPTPPKREIRGKRLVAIDQDRPSVEKTGRPLYAFTRELAKTGGISRTQLYRLRESGDPDLPLQRAS